jgi:hypothetical protein
MHDNIDKFKKYIIGTTLFQFLSYHSNFCSLPVTKISFLICTEGILITSVLKFHAVAT